MDVTEPRAAVWQAALSGDRTRLGELVYGLDWGHQGRIPDDTVQLVVDALLDPEFVACTAADVVAEAFEQNGICLGLDVKALSTQQHSKLMHAFESALPVAAYQLSFHLSVLLGERFHDAGALEVLRRLRAASDAGVRERVAHALQHFAVQGDDDQLKDAARAALLEMANDEDEGTRANVAYYLQNVSDGRVF